MTGDIARSLAIGAPEVILASGALVLLLIGTFRGDRALVGISWGAVLLFAVTALTIVDDTPERVLAWNDLYVADAFTAYLKLLILIGASVSVLLALPHLARLGSARFEYPVLIVLATLGMFLLVSANNFLALYVGLELLALASYVLAAFHRDDARSSEAGLKYFVLGALASGLILYGISFIYGFSGSVGFDAVAAALRLDQPLGVIAGLVFIFAGLAFKVSAVPFHMWTPDVYEGAPTPVAAFFAAAPKVAAMGLFMRVAVDAFGGLVGQWQQIVIFMAIASMLLGALGAIGQTNLKRLLAYSSINNVGFMLVGLAAATPAGISATLFYLAVYMVMTLGAFLALLALEDADGRPLETLDDVAGLARTRPWLAAALAVFMLSLAGIPPLFGFMPKLAVFNAAVEAGLFALAIIGVLATVVAAFYYLRLVKVMFFDPPAGLVVAPRGRVNAALMAAAALFVSPLGFLLLGPLGEASRRAAGALFS
jgi:NADH-quinone oxidoreductase subunit N